MSQFETQFNPLSQDLSFTADNYTAYQKTPDVKVKGTLYKPLCYFAFTQKITQIKVAYLSGSVTMCNFKTINEMSLVSLPPTSACVHFVVITNYDIGVASYGLMFIQGFMKSSQLVESRLNCLRLQLC
jgi:hypothetical protein